MDIAKHPPCFRWSFATLDVSKLGIHQIEPNHGHGLPHPPLVLLLVLVTCIRWWSLLRAFNNLPQVHRIECQVHLELPQVEVGAIELLKHPNTLTLQRCHGKAQTLTLKHQALKTC